MPNRVAVLALLALVSCKKEEKAEPPAPVEVQLAKVTRADLTDWIEAAGTLDAPPGMDVKLGPLVAGRLAQVLVAEGDAVTKNQLLARLDPLPLRDAVAQAKAQLAQARAQEANAKGRLERSQKAFEVGVAARQEVDDGKLALESAQASALSAQAALSTASNHFGRSELRAPFAGVVAHVFVAPGEPLDAGKPVVEVTRTNVLELRAPIAPDRAQLVRRGQAAIVEVDGLSGQSFPAQVIAVAPVIDAATGAALVRVRVDNAELLLKGGALARVRIAVALHKGVLAVPREALLSGEGGQGAAVEVVEKGKAQKKAVELGAQDGKLAEVTKGLAEGEQVIVQGAYALPDGTSVKAAEAAGSAPKAAASETAAPAKEKE